MKFTDANIEPSAPQARRAEFKVGRQRESETLVKRYRKQMNAEEMIRRISLITTGNWKIRRTKMTVSDTVIADRRLESLVESGLISRKEKMSWNRRIDDDKVSLSEVERFVAMNLSRPSKRL